MAGPWYVKSSSGSDSNTGLSWAQAYVTFGKAVSVCSAGDTIYVDSAHSETPGVATTYTLPGTATNLNKILCTASTSTPPVAGDLTTGAAIATTSSNSLNITGSFYMNGLSLTAGSGAGSAALNLISSGQGYEVYENCTLAQGGTAGANTLIGNTGAPSAASTVIWRNCNVNFANASSGIVVRNSWLQWFGGTLGGAAAPTNLFGPSGNTITNPLVDVRDVDLSVIGSSKFLVNVGNVNGIGFHKFSYCKINASLGGAITGTMPSDGSYYVDMISCDSGTLVPREERYRYAGNIKQETTIVKTGGSTDGTTAKSYKATTNSSAAYLFPLVGPDLYVWVNSTGSKTISIEIVNDGTTLKDNEAWMEIEYLGDASTPKGTFVTSASDILNAGTNITTSSATWTTTGLTTPIKQTISKTVTFNQKGLVRVRPVFAKASKTIYADLLLAVV